VDDGLPRRVAGLPDGSEISESKWRQESLKCFGNAIVPQVAMEIMRAIKEIEDGPET
jgi:DNA (cytosine-5)-methyltransferase 1